MKLTRTIAFRLFLLIATLQAVVLFVLAYAALSIQQSSMLEQVQESAGRIGNVIVRSTRQSMMVNRKEDVHGIVRDIGGEPGIDDIRIYNKSGEIVFATRAAEIGRRVDLTGDACVTCHANGELQQPTTRDLEREFTTPEGGRVLGLIRPIRNEPECAAGECHVHPASRTILGVVDVRMSLAAVDRQREAGTRRMIMLSLAAVVLVALTSGVFIWIVLRRPIRDLMAGMAMVSAGNLSHRLPINSSDELGTLADAFNTMTDEVARSRRENAAWTETLEGKVREKTAQLERSHRQMLHAEKMTSLGQMASTVAHELNNPLEGILTFAKLLIKRIDKSALPGKEKDEFRGDLKMIVDEAARSGGIVKNLLLFSRHPAAATVRARLRPILDRSILLVGHHSHLYNARLNASCVEDDELECDPGQIQQMLVALMMNAVEAMPPAAERTSPGVVSVDVTSSPDDGALSIRVSDDGAGMTDEVQKHIFEPFFTTKSDGKGVGLGLAVVYGIVERHHGRIETVSAPGEGTRFTVTLPRRQPENRAGAGGTNSSGGDR